MAAIFLSHAVADKKLAKLFTDFLKEAIGVPHDGIFCSSIDGHGVPMTEDFNKYMKDEIQEPELVLLLVTPSYMESAFCLMELGASWALSNRTLPIVVPPVSFSEVTRTLGLVQAWDIQKTPGIIDLRKAVKKTRISLEPRDDHVWESKKAEFGRAIKKLIDKLPAATKVAAEKYQKALNEIEAQKDEIEGLEKLVVERDALIDKLKTAKDAVAVKAIMKDAGDNDPEEEFDSLMDDVRATLPDVAYIVKIHILMDHYGKASRIDWANDRAEFETAVQKKLIDADFGHDVLWSGPKLKSLDKALQALDRFIESDEGKEYLEAKDNGLIEADDIDFWREYL